MQKGLQPSPGRIWVKKTGEPSLNRTSGIKRRSTGINTNKVAPAIVKSNKRFIMTYHSYLQDLKVS
jgi:hypothetical protein